jgi:hypothetical protein
MTGRQVHIQVKSVLEHNIRITPLGINYDLEKKNFDDLIDRKNELGGVIPLILIVFIFPSEQQDWLTLTPEELILRRQAYWYFPDDDLKYTENEYTQIIKIPKSNLVDLNFFSMIFNHFN